MNNLLFTALLIALLYYFFYYLPQQKKSQNPPTPIFETKTTQTDELATTIKEDPSVIQQLENEISAKQKDIQQQERTIIGLNNSYQKLETKTQQEIANLKKQLQAKDKKIEELSAVEKSLDQMIKNIQDLNQNLD